MGEMSELGRVRRQQIERCPVENAFMAFFALSDDDKNRMVKRFNAHQKNAAHPQRLLLEETTQ